ncbi:DUF6680 family protein [Pedobacter mendelii]|uniref:DUF6680 domain-containing protein n=1 Tax=Pedobacter mendelii TaxID=1908240 RepID=A0ABQ2BDL8_9SPHI|nr:DUF6680 family protein [Pedobacter mendelii]GGI23663.1 hypothetical protein GCM10008119_08770 [Pedobacter mendelii]
METLNVLFIVVTSLASGLVGVIISNRFFIKHERIKFKRDICLQLIANRNDLKGDEFTKALNSIIFAFNDDNAVIEKFCIFNDCIMTRNCDLDTSNRNLLMVIKAMLKHLNMEVKDIDDKYYLITFNPKN